ncbi:DENN domain-containing protein 5B isoform X2 [Ischnura elegans]|uniref:DENN domain-containing protein 5B isoform X2 n=1 Tax=Ischnura elegans TaxID=197161 RepID=UPI001ED899B0|nr:DENN domain-containing protein 5B isoform X2 [Ischnura elegans]
MNMFHNSTINRFADYFVICGLDISSGLELDRFSGDTLHCSPLDRPYKSKVLAHYPENVPWNVFDNEAVSMLCLPHGLRFRTQRHPLEPRFHSFITTREDGSRTYGFSLVFFEEVTERRICSAMQTLQAMHATEVASKRSVPAERGSKSRRGSSHTTRSLPRHFKLSVAEQELDASSATQMEYDAAQDSLYASKSIALVCQLPYVRAAKKFLTGLYKHAMDVEGGSTVVSFNSELGVFECLPEELSLESHVHNLLYEVCVPAPGRSVRFWCFGELLVLQRPSSIEEPPLFDFPLRLLFPLIGGPSRVLELFTCLLLENQVLLYSSDYQRLMLVAEGMTCLLFPFTWQHVYVPILPSSLTHFLDAPVPYVMGVSQAVPSWAPAPCCHACRPQTHKTKVASEANLCFVDIDNHVIQLPEDVPLFPQQHEFISEIYDLLVQYDLPPGDPTPQQSECGGGKACHRHKRRSRRKHSHDSDSASSSPTHLPPTALRRSTRRSSAAKSRADSAAEAMVRSATGTTGADASETLRRVLAIANNARVNLSSLELPQEPRGKRGEGTTPPHGRAIREPEQYVEDLKFNNALREVFLNRFVHMFSAYEHFVIQPDQDMEQWLSSRESMQNFDKATFLSDQPEPHLPFLSRFIESQMFATLIDNKILSNWQEVDSNLRVFDSRIRLLRKRFGDSLVRTPSYEPCTAIKETQLMLEKRLTSVDSTAPPPRPLPGAVRSAKARDKARRRRIAAATKQEDCSGLGGEEHDQAQSGREALRERLAPTLERLRCTEGRGEAHTPTAPSPAPLTHAPSFPLLDHAALGREPPTTSTANSIHHHHPSSLRAERKVASGHHHHHGGGEGGGSRTGSSSSSSASAMGGGSLSSDALLKTIRQPKLSGEPSPAEIAQTNWSFVEALLKDVKMRTKRMLVEKMGSEAVELGHVAASLSGLEENTLMASLCDLLERIWSHGLHKKQGKSALWSHLLSYQELEECGGGGKAAAFDADALTPDLSSMALESEIPRNGKFSTLPARGSSSSLSGDNNIKGWNVSGGSIMTRSLTEAEAPSLPPLPLSLTFDMRSVQGMSEIKTDIGFARAWVRLSLEKKLLSAHLRALTSEHALLRSLYKRYAFLRSDDEKEQFLYHLLTLNAVDYYCFTSTYTNTRIPYRVAIFPPKARGSGGGAVTSANAWVAAAGTLGGMAPVKIPKGSLQFVFHHKNLGILTTLRIGHDDSGPSPKWMVDHVIVRNEITGHLYKFPCGRWLGRGVDDDSTERLLVGEMMCPAGSPGVGQRGSREDLLLAGTEGGEGGGRRRRRRQSVDGRGTSPPSPPSPCRPPPRPPSVPEMQQMLADAVNSIVKYYYRPKPEKEALTLLLCGELGLVHCLSQVFLHGFKSTRLFGKKLYLWDYFVRVREEVGAERRGSMEGGGGGRSRSHSRSRGRDVVRQYCRLIERIANSSRTLGKDGKFQLLVCLGVREHILHRMIAPLSASKTTVEMFEEQSFLRDPSLSLYLCQILQSLDEFEFVLENSLTKGMMDTL